MSAERVENQSHRRRRFALTLAVVLPPVALLALSLPWATHEGSLKEIPCWVLPNLRIMATPGNEACPIGARQTIARASAGHADATLALRDPADLQAAIASAASPLRLELQEGTRKQWLAVPVRSTERATRLARVAAAAAAVSFLLGIPLFLVWRSSSRAAAPLAAFHACVSLVLITTLVGQHSVGLTRVALLALVLAPAAAMHLSMVFPRERGVIRDVPALLGVPYAFSALLIPVGWVSLERDPLLWPAFVSLLIALTAAAWAVLVLSCAFAIRESRSALERARARLVLYGTLLAPLLPTLLLSRGDHELGQIATAYLWSAAVTMPLPIALAIGRHNLFDLEWDARHAIARTVYLVLATFLVAVLLDVALIAAHVDSPLREPAPLALLAAACVLAVDALRSGTLGALEAFVAPQLQRLRRVREELERALGIQRDADEIVRLFGDALRTGISPRSGSVLIGDGDAWRVGYAFGEQLPARESAESALRVLGDRSRVHLAASSALQEQAADLVATGVEAVVALESGGTRYGLLLLGSLARQRPLSGVELDFAVALAAQAAIALRNARMTAERVASERHAATGRAALGLAHDVGKDLGWMRALVKRLPERVGDAQRLTRDATRIAELTDGLAGAIERFVREATEDSCAAAAERRLAELVEEATRRVERLHGEGRVAQNVDPALRGLRMPESLGRAIGNLLDNALHASPDGAQVHLIATYERQALQIAIEDAGCGISEQALARVFEPGFTTRAGSGGSGVGLPVALEIVAARGGRLELRSGPRGTRATIHLPVVG